MKLTGARILMECLREQKVDTIFGYPGGTILNVYDEFELHGYKDKIRHILTAHEQSRTPGEPHTYLLQLPVENHSNRIAQEVCRQSTLVGFHEKLPSLSELFIRFANGEEAPVALPETPRFPFQKL